jgi:hypothetical protein
MLGATATLKLAVFYLRRAKGLHIHNHASVDDGLALRAFDQKRRHFSLISPIHIERDTRAYQPFPFSFLEA